MDCVLQRSIHWSGASEFLVVTGGAGGRRSMGNDVRCRGGAGQVVICQIETV